VFIGAVTFTGSIVAYGKLNGTFKMAIFKSAPLQLPGGHWLNLAAILASVVLLVWFMSAEQPPMSPLVLMTLIAFLFQWALYSAVINRISASSLGFLQIIPFSVLSVPLLACFLAVGLLVAVFGSRIAIRNYMRI